MRELSIHPTPLRSLSGNFGDNSYGFFFYIFSRGGGEVMLLKGGNEYTQYDKGLRRNLRQNKNTWTYTFNSLQSVATPLLEECEDDTHIPEMGTWESSRTPETSEFDCRRQNTSSWDVLHVVGKILKCRCQKWPCMSHLDISSTSYGKKKGRDSNWQFDS
jgi:hypothetical protein